MRGVEGIGQGLVECFGGLLVFLGVGGVGFVLWMLFVFVRK